LPRKGHPARVPVSVNRGRYARVTLVLWALAAVLAADVVARSVRAVRTSSNGFVAYYTAARLLAEGAGAARFYDDDWFRGQVARFEPRVLEIHSGNPPTMGLLLLPLAWADYRLARGSWIAATLLLLVGTAGWLVRRERLDGFWAPAFLCIALLAYPVRENISHGQAYVLAFALLTTAWQGYRTSRDGLLGVPLGVLLVTKTASLMLWPLLLVERRWRAVAWGAGTAAVLALAALPLTGMAAWTRYVPSAAEVPFAPARAVTAYQTQTGFFRHLLGPGGAAVGEPVISAPLVASVLSIAVALLLLGTSLRAALRSERTASVFSAFVLLGLILSPVSSEAHYAMALLPLALLASELRARGVPLQGAAALAAGAVLIALPFPFRSPRLADGLLALLAYPRLYGALLLWALALVWSLSPRYGTAGLPSRAATGARSWPADPADFSGTNR
jgi:hypothetical protein